MRKLQLAGLRWPSLHRGDHHLDHPPDPHRLAARTSPSASIGISLVAIPVFLTLLGVILYVFWGLLRRSEASR